MPVTCEALRARWKTSIPKPQVRSVTLRPSDSISEAWNAAKA